MRFSRLNLTSLLIVFPITVIYFILFAQGFFDFGNVLNIARQGVMLAFATFGMALTLITGGIDLSVGAVMGLTSVTFGVLLLKGTALLPAVLVALLVGFACGAINGLNVSYLRLPPFIATFGMAGMAMGLGLVMTDGRTQSGLNAARVLDANPLGIPLSLWLVAIVGVALEVGLKRTGFGVSLYALGGNAEAARLAGIDVRRQRFLAYLISGGLAGLAGLLLAARMVSANATAGENYAFDSVAAAIVGGVRISGGKGGISGAFAGAAYVSIMRNGMNLMGFPFSLQIVGVGLVIVIIFLLDGVLERIRRRPGKEVVTRVA